MSRFLGMFLFAAVICVASDCHAQRQRGWLRSGARVQHGASHYDTRQQQDQLQNNEYSPRNGSPAVSPYYDSRNSRSYSPAETYPKYYGGFHSSHFNNIGIPTGDIGFRGNSIYWSPW